MKAEGSVQLVDFGDTIPGLMREAR